MEQQTGTITLTNREKGDEEEETTSSEEETTSTENEKTPAHLLYPLLFLRFLCTM